MVGILDFALISLIVRDLRCINGGGLKAWRDGGRDPSGARVCLLPGADDSGGMGNPGSLADDSRHEIQIGCFSFLLSEMRPGVY